MAGVPYLLERLGIEAYGVVGVVAVVVSQMAWLQLGVGPATTRRVAEALGHRDGPGLQTLFRASAMVGLGSGALAATVIVVVGPWLLARAVGGGPLLADLGSIAAAGAVTTFALSLSASGLAAVLGQERFTVVAALRVFQGAGRMAAAVGAASAGLGLVGVLWSLAGVDLASAIIALKTGAPRAETRLDAPSSGPAMLDLLGLGIPFAVTTGMLGLLADAEKIVIAWARPIGDFAFYSVPHNVALRLGGLAMAFAGNLVPRLAFLGASEGVDATLAMVRRAGKAALGLVGVGLSLLIPVVPELLGAWLGPEFVRNSSGPARLLLLVVLVNTGGSTYNALLRARVRPVVLVLVYLVQIPPYLVVLYGCVREWGIQGAAAALFLRSLFDLACHRYAVDKALGGRAGGISNTLTALGPLVLLSLVCELAGGRWLLTRIGMGLAVGTFIALRLLSAAEWKAILSLVPIPRWR